MLGPTVNTMLVCPSHGAWGLGVVQEGAPHIPSRWAVLPGKGCMLSKTRGTAPYVCFGPFLTLYTLGSLQINGVPEGSALMGC